MFGAVNLTKNTDFNIYKYSGYGSGFDEQDSYLLSDGSGFGKNLKVISANMSSFAHHSLTSEKEHAKNFSEQQKKS